MADLSTKWMGLRLKSPLIVGSSGLTGSVNHILEYEKQGAGAVVLKSLFEEQIIMDIRHAMQQDTAANAYPEALDYITNYSRSNAVDDYLRLIRDCKAQAGIPVIASINCSNASDWTEYAGRIEEAGADAIELNTFILPSDSARPQQEIEKVYFDILESVLGRVSIPVSMKIGWYFTGLAQTARKLSWAGAKGLVLFNRFYSPDIDIEAIRTIPAPVFSSPEEIHMPLRWIAILSGVVNCDLAASTGVHDGKGMVKMLLAGAGVVQIASTVYRNGSEIIARMLNDLEKWMDSKQFVSISDFRGRLSYKNTIDPAAYERVQFMKYFSGIE